MDPRVYHLSQRCYWICMCKAPKDFRSGRDCLDGIRILKYFRVIYIQKWLKLKKHRWICNAVSSHQMILSVLISSVTLWPTARNIVRCGHFALTALKCVMWGQGREHPYKYFALDGPFRFHYPLWLFLRLELPSLSCGVGALQNILSKIISFLKCIRRRWKMIY